MNNHLERLRDEQDKIKKQKLKNTRLSRMIVALALFSFSLTCLVGVMATIDPLKLNKEESGEQSAGAVGSLGAVNDDEWQLILVNRDNYLSSEFTVDLKTFGNIRIDCRIADALQAMIDDAAAAGITLLPVSGYRSVSEQRTLYEAKCATFLEQGYGMEAAEIYARQTQQPPGASEHHTGLAIDFLTDGVSELSESFAQTQAYVWLSENAEKYGFIERYPKDKSKLTGILWEPWHYRYVGESNAKALNSMGICIEEFT